MDSSLFQQAAVNGLFGSIALAIVARYRSWKASRRAITLERNSSGTYVDRQIRYERYMAWTTAFVWFGGVAMGLFLLMYWY